MHFSLFLEAKGKRVGALLDFGGLVEGVSWVTHGEVSLDLEIFFDRNCIPFLLDMPLDCCRPGRRVLGSAAIGGVQPARKIGVSDREIVFFWLS